MFTPNHVELAAIFGCPNPENVDADVNQALALRFVDSGSSIVVRWGKRMLCPVRKLFSQAISVL